MPPKLGDVTMSKTMREDIFRNAKTIVVKIGTGVLSAEDGRLEGARVAEIAEQVCGLVSRGYKVVIVSSGAIGAGMAELKMDKRPTLLPQLQAAASVGQGKLIAAYEERFKRRGYHAAQMLLTRDDFEDRARYLNARNTILALLDLGAVPVINENDSIRVEEITFSDNDLLSALVTTLVRADVLVMLSTVKGLYKDGHVVDVVERIDESVRRLSTGAVSRRGSGGMESKLQAAEIATRAGIPVIVADGREKEILLRVADGEKTGTLFMPSSERMSSRKGWIGLTVRPKGRIYVDGGARDAVANKGRSLLPSGITRVEGRFERGDIVAIVAEDGGEFARGLVNYSSEELARIKGLKTSAIAGVLGSRPYDEAVHRDNMAVM